MLVLALGARFRPGVGSVARVSASGGWNCSRGAHHDPGHAGGSDWLRLLLHPATAGSAALGTSEGASDAASAATVALNASATGLRFVRLKVPSRRGADAKSVANAACTAITAPTCATNRRDPFT